MEFDNLLDREISKLSIVFQKVNPKSNQIKDLWNMILSYWEDCKHFYKSGKKLEAFELVNYIWGLLDALANLDLIEVPAEIKKWFKIEQDV
jgi:hypothetical protein